MSPITSNKGQKHVAPNGTARLRISREVEKKLREFCGREGVSPDDAIRDLLGQFENVRAGGYGSELGALIADLNVLNGVNAKIVQTNLLLIAEMRNLQAAHYLTLGAQTPDGGRHANV